MVQLYQKGVCCVQWCREEETTKGDFSPQVPPICFLSLGFLGPSPTIYLAQVQGEKVPLPLAQDSLPLLPCWVLPPPYPVLPAHPTSPWYVARGQVMCVERHWCSGSTVYGCLITTSAGGMLVGKYSKIRLWLCLCTSPCAMLHIFKTEHYIEWWGWDLLVEMTRIPWRNTEAEEPSSTPSISKQGLKDLSKTLAAGASCCQWWFRI